MSEAKEVFNFVSYKRGKPQAKLVMFYNVVSFLHVLFNRK